MIVYGKEVLMKHGWGPMEQLKTIVWIFLEDYVIVHNYS